MNGSYYPSQAGISGYCERIPANPTKKLTQPCFEIKPTMDLCNLYVKDIEAGLTSANLFNLFKPFGRIISARVMKEVSKNNSSRIDPDNNKCFGFVSFSQPIEAAQAIITMHQQTDDGKNRVVVRFHEPRVSRPEHNFSQQIAILIQHSELASHFYTRSKHYKKIVPLRPVVVEDGQDITNTSYASQRAMYSASLTTSPLSFYCPIYWINHHGMIYTNVYRPCIQQFPSTIYNYDDTRRKLFDMLEQRGDISVLDQKLL